jgi:hypothetical protein
MFVLLDAYRDAIEELAGHPESVAYQARVDVIRLKLKLLMLAYSDAEHVCRRLSAEPWPRDGGESLASTYRQAQVTLDRIKRASEE